MISFFSLIHTHPMSVTYILHPAICHSSLSEQHSLALKCLPPAPPPAISCRDLVAQNRYLLLPSIFPPREPDFILVSTPMHVPGSCSTRLQGQNRLHDNVIAYPYDGSRIELGKDVEAGPLAHTRTVGMGQTSCWLFGMHGR